MSVTEQIRPEAPAVATEADFLEEIDRQIETIAGVFFDVIDDPKGCVDGPVQVGYFMDEESSGTHVLVRETLLKGVQDLCDHPDSNCVLADDLNFAEGERVILISEKSGNQLVERRQGEPSYQFASIFWIRKPKQKFPY